MMVKVVTASLFGLAGRPVQVEVDLAKGFPGYNVVGLAGTTIRESGYRVRSAMVNEGYNFPAGRITINLSPAESRKEGSHFDLPIAVGLLSAMGEVPFHVLNGLAVFGELSLDGRLVPVKGALPLISTVVKAGITKVVIPFGNREEAALARDVEIYPAETLKEVIGFLKGERKIKPWTYQSLGERKRMSWSSDFSDVRGQESVKRVMVICAAGGHGLWMRGSSGVGKTMMAQRLPTIMPPMSFEEKVEVTNIYSVAGLLSEEVPLIEERPFRSPHHTVTMAGLLGGGRSPRPGEFSLAHGGILFLDELPQFEARVLDALRQPLEEERVTVARQGGAAIFPGRVILVAASNPCKCGYLEDKAKECSCSAAEIARYQARLTNPFLDRIDLHVRVGRESTEGEGCFERMSSEKMAGMVAEARERQKRRYGKGIDREGSYGVSLNSRLSPRGLAHYCRLGDKEEKLLKEAFETLHLSMRTYHRTIKIARTIADIEGKENIGCDHIAEALQYRGREREHEA